MRLLLSCLLFIFCTPIFAQDSINNNKDGIQVIHSFIQDLADQEKAIDVILSQHLLVSNPSDELYDYLEVSLQEVRINLMTKKIAEIKYIPFAKMPRRDVKDIDPEDLDTNNMYFLHYRNRQMLAVYVENGKIGSFTLVSKGYNRAHFIKY
ncbi:MAG TPA: hypothetical protein PKA53_13990 [Sphingobacterium sp.]|nr:hypothetical protein [Sphingobacterium sp.]